MEVKFLSRRPAYQQYLADVPNERLHLPPYTPDENGHVPIYTGEVFCRYPLCPRGLTPIKTANLRQHVKRHFAGDGSGWTVANTTTGLLNEQGRRAAIAFFESLYAPPAASPVPDYDIPPMTANMSSEFAGKVYIVTGGASGIGLAIVKDLLALFAIVHAIDLAPSFPEIGDPSASTNLFVYPNVNVSERAQVASTFEKILQHSGRVDGVVNNAGIAPISTEVIESDETFERVFDVNVKGTWNVGTQYLRYVHEQLLSGGDGTQGGEKKEGIGCIVNIASTGAMHAFPGMAAYCASKHAVLGLTRSWAKEWTSRGIRTNCVAPGGTDTPLSGALDEGVKDAYRQMMPMGRIAKPDEVADAVTFLLSGRSSFITGQMIPVEGGLHV